jgi:hypothetical protein
MSKHQNRIVPRIDRMTNLELYLTSGVFLR